MIAVILPITLLLAYYIKICLMTICLFLFELYIKNYLGVFPPKKESWAHPWFKEPIYTHSIRARLDLSKGASRIFSSV